MEVFTESMLIFAIELKIEMSILGPSNTFAGLKSASPSLLNDMSMAISQTPDNARKWPAIIVAIIASRPISHDTLGSSIGRLAFAQTAVTGRYAH